MSLKDYLTDNIFAVICFFITDLLVLSMLWLIETSIIFIVFLEVIFIISFLVPFIWNYWRKYNYYNKLLSLLDNLDEKTLLAEIIDKPSFLDGKILYNILRRSNKYQNDKISEIEQRNLEYREYIDRWVHEIKTPITSVRLIVENEKNTTTLRIDDELRKIDNFVEQVLYYSRSTAIEKDFRIEKITLRTIVNNVLKNYSKEIIQAGGHLDIKSLDIPIYTDIKSCVFIIGQVISNSIKYRKSNFHLRIYSQIQKNNVSLIIYDNGIGISSSDLLRVFDKGFTGENGRRFSRSTGIGLYLCKKLCDKMNIDLNINSIKGKGTTVSLSFPIATFIYNKDL